MWTCPVCGRAFARQDQQHYCVKPETVDAYIAAQEEAARPALNRMRDILRTALPDAEECISWSMPTYRKGRNLIHFAAAKNISACTPATRPRPYSKTGWKVWR